MAGIGQGNGAGPHIWVAVSSPLFQLMRDARFYVSVIAAISLQQRHIVGFAFVDDTDLCIAGPHITNDNVVHHMQASVNNWEGYLRATGGALVPEKSFWYLLEYQYIGNKWRLASKQQHRGNITVRNSKGKVVIIPWLDTTKAWRTLGV